MKDGNLKNQMQDEFAKITPDIKEKVISSCLSVEQEEADVEEKKPNVWLKRVIVAFACLVFFAGGAVFGFFIPAPQATAQAETLLYLDVNPSVEMTLDEDNRVISVVAGNEDASDILHGLDLEDVDLNTALNAIVGSMYIHGYLSEDSNSILVSVDTKHNENENGMLAYVTEKINKVFENSELECSILAQGMDVDEDLKKRAKEQGVSVGKMHLVDKLKEIDGFEEDSVNNLTSMSIKDLNHIYSSSDKNHGKDDIVSGNVNGYINKKEAVNMLLTHLDVAESDIEYIRFIAQPTFSDAQMQINYLITLKVNGIESRLFEMNCKTGEITELEFVDEPPMPSLGNGENHPQDGKDHNGENNSHDGGEIPSDTPSENGNSQHPPADGEYPDHEPHINGSALRDASHGGVPPQAEDEIPHPHTEE